jgi:hypothetical protein
LLTTTPAALDELSTTASTPSDYLYKVSYFRDTDMGANCSGKEAIVLFDIKSPVCKSQKRSHETPAVDADLQRSKNLQLLADRKKLDRYLLVRNLKH